MFVIIIIIIIMTADPEIKVSLEVKGLQEEQKIELVTTVISLDIWPEIVLFHKETQEPLDAQDLIGIQSGMYTMSTFLTRKSTKMNTFLKMKWSKNQKSINM